jgi:hypothetical protein
MNPQLAKSELVKVRVSASSLEEPTATSFKGALTPTARLQGQIALLPTPSSSLALQSPHLEVLPTESPVLRSSATAPLTHSLDLLCLPTELLLHLTSFLPFNALLALRSTCHSLHDVLSPYHITSQRKSITKRLIASEQADLHEYRHSHPRQRYSHLWDLFYAAFEWQLQERPAKELICYGCLETKPLHCFVERMSTRGTGLGGGLAKHRRCKDCMRRFYSVGGAWWREHWVRKSEHRKRRTRVERVARWITHGDSLVENIERGAEVGVCACCGGRQSELWWGCSGCLEKEEMRRRKEDREVFRGTLTADQAEHYDEGWLRWVIDKSEHWRTKRERQKRRRDTRRVEQGRWWRRVWRHTRRGAMLRWEGSWERVEALVELLQGPGKDSSSDPRTELDADHKSMETEEEWKPLDHVPLSKDRREARCSYCWVPTCQGKTFMLGLAYETDLPFERWCNSCQEEHIERQQKRKWRKEIASGQRLGSVPDEEEVLEGMQRLFI